MVAAGGGIGFLPTFIAMFALALPPMFVSTSTGIAEVDRVCSTPAGASGMTPRQLVRRVELPLAMPLIFSGARIAVSQVVATATLGAFVGLQHARSLHHRRSGRTATTACSTAAWSWSWGWR